MTLRARLQRSPRLGFFALTCAWCWGCRAPSPAIRPQLPWPASLRVLPSVVAMSIAFAWLPGMRVPEMGLEHMAGHHVLLCCAQADVFIGHLSPGSVQVRAGDTVAAGVRPGAVGNPGHTGGPHLQMRVNVHVHVHGHVHAQRPGPSGAPIGGDPWPNVVDGHFRTRGDHIHSPGG